MSEDPKFNMMWLGGADSTAKRVIGTLITILMVALGSIIYLVVSASEEVPSHQIEEDRPEAVSCSAFCVCESATPPPVILNVKMQFNFIIESDRPDATPRIHAAAPSDEPI